LLLDRTMGRRVAAALYGMSKALLRNGLFRCSAGSLTEPLVLGIGPRHSPGPFLPLLPDFRCAE
jgi:hypothetical protein